jgi:hypothetical protein
MIIDKDKRFMFIHNPRTSGTSIRRALASEIEQEQDKIELVKLLYRDAVKAQKPTGTGSEIDWKHASLDILPDSFADGYSYVFVTVRNPYIRLLSYYLRFHQDVESNIYNGFKKYIDNTYSRHKEGDIQLLPRLKQAHWYNHPSIDEVVKCEDIDLDKWKLILQKCSLDPNIERKKGVCQSLYWKRPDAHSTFPLPSHLSFRTPLLLPAIGYPIKSDDYMRVYDDQMREKVYEMCQEDMERFNYQFEEKWK